MESFMVDLWWKFVGILVFFSNRVQVPEGFLNGIHFGGNPGIKVDANAAGNLEGFRL